MLTPPSSAADRPGNSAEDGAVSDFVRAVPFHLIGLYFLDSFHLSSKMTYN
jgi:hypothetical protein